MLGRTEKYTSGSPQMPMVDKHLCNRNINMVHRHISVCLVVESNQGNQVIMLMVLFDELPKLVSSSQGLEFESSPQCRLHLREGGKSYIQYLATEHHSLKHVNDCLNTNIYSYLDTSGGQRSNLYLNVIQLFNTSVNQTSVAAYDSCFPSLVSNT